jgi:murein L,D-transpeptidase YafK
LGLNYPNSSDKILSDSLQPGSDIYIHGSCVTTGCIPITNPQIEELYILSLHAHNAGQDFIPVHIYPVRYNVPKSMQYLENLMKEDKDLRAFEDRLKKVHDHFEQRKKLPVIGINTKGDYVVL